MTKKLTLLFLFILFFISCSTYKGLNSQKRFLLNETGDEKYYLIEFIKLNQIENKLGEVPTLMINNTNGNIIIRSDKEYHKKLKLRKDDIKRITIIDMEKAPQIYGSAGKNGVITINTY